MRKLNGFVTDNLHAILYYSRAYGRFVYCFIHAVVNGIPIDEQDFAITLTGLDRVFDVSNDDMFVIPETLKSLVRHADVTSRWLLLLPTFPLGSQGLTIVVHSRGDAFNIKLEHDVSVSRCVLAS